MNTITSPTELTSDLKTSSAPNRLKSLPNKPKVTLRRPEFDLNISIRNYLYDALKDRNLSRYFANPRKRSHLLKMNLLGHTGCSTQKHISNQLGRDRGIVLARDIEFCYLDKRVMKKEDKRYNEVKIKKIKRLMLPSINPRRRLNHEKGNVKVKY